MVVYDIKWYSGSVLNERPVSIITDGEETEILKIVSEELREDYTSKNREKVFVVDTRKGRFNIRCELAGKVLEVIKTDVHFG